jgi:hypothetical protein
MTPRFDSILSTACPKQAVHPMKTPLEPLPRQHGSSMAQRSIRPHTDARSDRRHMACAGTKHRSLCPVRRAASRSVVVLGTISTSKPSSCASTNMRRVRPATANISGECHTPRRSGSPAICLFMRPEATKARISRSRGVWVSKRTCTSVTSCSASRLFRSRSIAFATASSSLGRETAWSGNRPLRPSWL